MRVAIPSSVDEALLRYLPGGVEVVRYEVDGSDTLDVDVLVPPSFGKQAAAVLPRIHARYIQAISAGVETLAPLVPAGTTLLNAQGVHNSATAEWVLAAVLASLKWLPLYGGLQAEGRWAGRDEAEPYWRGIYGSPPDRGVPVLLEDLGGQTVLIVGYGSIGKAIETRLLPFEPAEILRVARTARLAAQPPVSGVQELAELLPRAGVVILIMPLTPETHHLIGRDQLQLMRRGALLVNAARGGVVDTEALVEALRARHIRAALDVTDPEPLPPGHPLWSCPGLLLTPHIAGSTPLFLDRVYRFLGQQLTRLRNGEEPENIIRGHY